MKIKQPLLLLLAIITIFCSSCTKKEVAEDNNNTPTETGIIKVSISYSPPSSTSYVYFISEQFTVKLSSGGSVIATQFYGNNTLDMGEYDYGTYTITVTGKEGRTSLTTGSTTNNYDSFNSTKTLTLDASTKTATFSF